MAIGSSAVSTGTNSIALGANSTDGGAANVLSIGTVGGERRITNVATGTATTDAVNFGQLNNFPIKGNNSSALAFPTAAGNDALSAGYGATAVGAAAAAFGKSATPSAANSVAIGSSATSSGVASTAVGSGGRLPA